MSRCFDRGHEDGLEIDAGRPHPLLGLGQDVEPHHADREEGAGRGRRKLHRQRVLQQALGALEVRRQRQVGQPGRDRLRLVAGRHAVEVAVRQRRRVEEIRGGEIREADVFHPAPLVPHADRPPLADLDAAGDVDEVPARLRVEHLVVGAHVRRVERIGERVEPEAEVVVDRVGLVQHARRKQRTRVLRVEVAGLVIVVVFGPRLDAHGEARRGDPDGPRATHAVLVGAVEAVEAVQPLDLGRKCRLRS